MVEPVSAQKSHKTKTETKEKSLSQLPCESVTHIDKVFWWGICLKGLKCCRTTWLEASLWVYEFARSAWSWSERGENKVVWLEAFGQKWYCENIHLLVENKNNQLTQSLWHTFWKKILYKYDSLLDYNKSFCWILW
jgi:hypothetical protein